MTVITHGGREVSIAVDRLSAVYSGTNHIREVVVAEQDRGADGSVRALVELRRHYGGYSPRAVLGAQFCSMSGDKVILDVLVGDEPYVLGRDATCRSDLGSPLVAGLTREFAEAALSGLADPSPGLLLPSGTLHVDRAAYWDESIPNIFYLAGVMLRTVIAAKISGEDHVPIASDIMVSW
jgi:hypothetical protein